MNIHDKLKKSGFTPSFSCSKYSVFKGDKGVYILHSDGNIEAFLKGHLEESGLNEDLSRQIAESVILLGLGITYFTTDITIVNGVSMDPTYKNGQILIRSKKSKEVNRLLASRNSVVKFKSPEGDTCIKRVVAMPGDKVEFNGSNILVNGQLVDSNNQEWNARNLQRMVRNGKSDSQTEIKILKQDEYFVLGDNRDESIDSRNYGPIDGNCIISVIEK